nr:META domain-containing protein [uncultured Actinotalea sp.]
MDGAQPDDGAGPGPGPDGASGAHPDDAPHLDGRSFVAVEAHGHEIVPGTTVRVTFGEGRVGVRAGGNTMTGVARWSDGTLVIGPMAMTRMLCPPAIAAQDQWLADLVGGAPAVTLDGATLRLEGARGALVLVEDDEPQR